MASVEKEVLSDEKQAIDVEQTPSPEKHPSAAVLKHANDADEAMLAFVGHEGEIIELDEATNKRLLRRIDWNLMPIMCAVYAMNYLDSEKRVLLVVKVH